VASPDKSFLFVYGTLRRGEAAAHLLAGAEFIGEANIEARVIQHGQFTGLVAGEGHVAGELFEVPTDLFGRLDEYEGAGYTRKLCEVVSGGSSLTAWVYWLV
jgi:gamma-glutamylcyclotransferase (GGCT)/AIG2-like uncharacterized protein YtfP